MILRVLATTLAVLLLVACQEQEMEETSFSEPVGTWVTSYTMPLFGNWFVVLEDGTYFREESAGSVVESDDGICISDERNATCHPVKIDANRIEINVFGTDILFHRINASALESRDAGEFLIGRWEWLGSGIDGGQYMDFLPSGRMLATSGLDLPTEAFWSATETTFCFSDDLSIPVWQGDCLPIEIDGDYLNLLSHEGDYLLTLRRIAP